MPETCDRSGCAEPRETVCLSCQRPFCWDHLAGPDGHVCLESVVFTDFNARILDDDEAAVALERGVRPLP